MLRLFKRLFGKARHPPQPEPVDASAPEADSLVRRTDIGLTVDLDHVPSSAREEFYQELVKQNEAPIFEGEVEHGYTAVAAGGTAKCPRCQAPTTRHCAHFIYATDRATRVMLAPAGFFCSRCPTVIVDEAVIVQGVKAGFQFRGVVGIDFAGNKEPALFRTWNGRKPVYIFDEDEQIMGLDALPLSYQETRPASWVSQRKKLKRKRQIAKHSRQRNRRR
jgi:hypothetical protein